MAHILRKLPFFAESNSVPPVAGSTIPVAHDQIVLWLSATPAGQLDLGNVPRFPAVFDSGFNDNFLIQRQQLIDWAGLIPEELTQVGYLKSGDRLFPLRDADVWLHCNKPGFRDEFSTKPPFRLELRSGIAVSTVPGLPRLPLLGMLALRRARLQQSINYRDCHMSLRT